MSKSQVCSRSGGGEGCSPPRVSQVSFTRAGKTRLRLVIKKKCSPLINLVWKVSRLSQCIIITIITPEDFLFQHLFCYDKKKGNVSTSSFRFKFVNEGFVMCSLMTSCYLITLNSGSRWNNDKFTVRDSDRK